MPEYQVEANIVAREFWLTTVSANSDIEAVEIVRREAERNFMPETFEIDVFDIRVIE